MRLSKYAVVFSAVATFGLASASEGLAQACIGTPIVSGQRAISAGVGFPEGATNYNARLDVNAMGPLAAHATYTRSAMNDVGGGNHIVGTGVAYQLPTPVIPGNVSITGCPAVGLSYAFSDGANVDDTRLDVPVGFGLGTRVGIGAGMAVVPYVVPQFVFSRTSTRFNVAGDRMTTTDTGFGATVGSALDFGPFFAGVDLSTTRWNEVPRTDSQVGIRIGVKF